MSGKWSGRNEKKAQVRWAFLIVFFVFIPVLLGQSVSSGLRSKLDENGKLFQENLDAAYRQFDEILSEARAQKDTLAELIILDRKCKYFYSKNQLGDLMTGAEILQVQAKRFKDLYSQAMANIYLAEAYSINGMHEKALQNLNIAYETLDNETSRNPRIFFAKANVLNSFANVYSDKGEPEMAVKKLLQAIKSYETLQNPEDINRFQYVNYSNVSTLYLLFDIDSAAYYANQSIQLKPKDAVDDKIMMMNYFVLGKVKVEKKNYEEALDYFYKSMGISQKIGVELNAKEVYTAMIDVFGKKGNTDSVILYENKLKELEINILKGKYNSLQKVIDREKKQESDSFPNNWIWGLAGILFVSIAGLIYFKLKKKRSRDVPIEKLQESYHHLLEMAKKDDPAFMYSFDQTFPGFSDKLLAINPQLSKSEIEFCALLKLNISTKDIAKLSSIEPRTVQNKKYRIRKRLRIPSEADIYNWIDLIS